MTHSCFAVYHGIDWLLHTQCDNRISRVESTRVLQHALYSRGFQKILVVARYTSAGTSSNPGAHRDGVSNWVVATRALAVHGVEVGRGNRSLRTKKHQE